MTKKLILVLIVGGGIYYFMNYDLPSLKVNRPEITAEGRFNDTDSFIKNAFENRKRNVRVTGSGVVVSVNPAGNSDGRHQRFTVRLASGLTVTVVHDTEISRRIEGMRPGDTIDFCGSYDWDIRGGTITRTYRDPKNRHAAGWLKHKGQIYQ